MSGATVEIEGLSFSYGERTALDNVSFEVTSGAVFGLLGPNGECKTACIRVFLDFIRPTSGSATVLRMNSRANSVRIHQQVGYLPGDFITYEKLTALELLECFANQRRDITN